MSKQFNSLDTLFKHLINEIQESMDKDVGEKVAQETKEQMDITVYDAGKPKYYATGTSERTYELRESVRNNPAQVNGNEVSVKIDHDYNKIHSDPENYIHGSVDYEPQDANEWVPYYVHEGKSGDRFGEGYWRDKRPYFDDTVDRLEKNNAHVNELKKSLRQKGFDVK